MHVKDAFGPVATELNHECDRITRALEYAQQEVDRLSREAPEACARFKENFNVKIIKLLDDPKYKTDKLREAKAQADCAKDYLDYKLKESLLEAARSAVWTYRAQLTAWQTKCGNVKAENEVSRAPQPQW